MLKTLICAISTVFACAAFSQTFTRSELPVALDRPWEMTYGPDDHLWLTQAGGIVTRVNPETGESSNIYTAPDYFPGSPLEAFPDCFNPTIGYGTLGLTLHPQFSTPKTSYIYYVYSYNSGTDMEPATKFKIKRLKWDAEAELITETDDLVTNIPTSYDHLGGRLLAVEQDGVSYLFLTIGDHGMSEDNSPDCYEDQSLNPNNWAQDPSTMNGKIHRFNMDGTIPNSNPIPGNSFYTRGHRNPQGLIYNHDLNILYDVEHGDRTDDEINVLKKGMNYGWKHVRGYHDGNHPGELEFIANYTPHADIENDALIPAFYSWCDSEMDGDPDNSTWCTVAPSDGIYYCSNAIPQWNNSLLVVTLKDGEGTDKEVYQFKLTSEGELMPSTPDNPNPKRFFGEDQDLNGRLRDIAISPDGTKIYLINNGGATEPGSKITVYTLNPDSVEPYMATEQNCVGAYPNPATVSLRFLGIEQLTNVESIEAITVSGELIATYLPDDIVNGCSIDISNWGAGTYTVRINYQDGTCSVKVVKAN